MGMSNINWQHWLLATSQPRNSCKIIIPGAENSSGRTILYADGHLPKSLVQATWSAAISRVQNKPLRIIQRFLSGSTALFTSGLKQRA